MRLTKRCSLMIVMKKSKHYLNVVEVAPSFALALVRGSTGNLKKGADRAISNQICDVRTKFDILYAFVNVSLCLTHRKHSIQRALDSPGSGERFKYVERAQKVYRKFFRDI